MKKKKEEIDNEKIKNKAVKVEFLTAYSGKLGEYKEGEIYELPLGVYSMLRINCKEV